ncbi:MAG: TonB-dependent receptor [Bacteroidetes bacterium]|nr:TonB-dependent receptor [Bacteroidota bacterium]
MIGVNILVAGTVFGAATDLEGYYLINNLPPGKYTINISAVGYQKKQFVDVRIAVDFTTKLDVTLMPESVQLETIVVQAQSPLIRTDLTSSQVTVDADQIDNLPVESISQLLTLQAGIVEGAGGDLHIRGGRSNEILYTVNGVSIANPFDNTKTVSIATNAIQELSVVSGTFNAEYGNALSGIVNTVTKEGGSVYKGKISFYTGDHLSSRENVFFNINNVNPLSTYTGEMTLGGPVPFASNKLLFFVSGRYDREKGWLYGIREHNTTDSVYINPTNPNDIRIASTGDGAVVPMNPSQDFSGTAKLTYKPFPMLKINYDLIYSRSDYKNYSQDFKYNPDAMYNNYELGLLNSIEIRHALNEKTFYTLHGSYNFNDYKQFLYPLLDGSGNTVNYYPGMVSNLSGSNLYDVHADPRYQPDYKLNPVASYTFLSGGTLNGQYYQRSKTIGAKFDLTSQITNNHEVKLGVDYKSHQLDFENFTILRDSTTYTSPTIPALSTTNHDYYIKKPKEFSAYVQDKMEFKSIILNVGLRYDYFNANSQYSTDIFYPSPNYPNIPSAIDPNSLLATAPAKHQFSPRVGISFPITDQGIIHFSYGHFFQMPPFSYLYTNPYFKYSLAMGTPIFGNANLNPEKTVTYELGLQQQLMEDLAFNVTGFYKDIRDLLAMQEIRISGDQTYFKYVNKDYGNVKGITFSLIKRRTLQSIIGVTLDYTFQVAEGNETNTDAFFLDLASGRQSEKIPVYLTWDQTHTLNATVSVGKSDWNITLVGRLGTGLPYTPQISGNQIYLRANSGRRPSQAVIDLLAEKALSLYGFDFTIFLKIFNLFDTLNERVVYNDTGRATYTLVANQSVAVATDDLSKKIPSVHSADEYFNQPTYYQPPREVKLGLSMEF